MRLCFLNNEVTEPWPQTKTEEILKSKSTLLKASCHLLLNQRVRITLFWKTSLVLIAFYVNISLQFTLVEHRYMAAVGFGWARLLLCLLMPCRLLLSSVITDNIPSFLITRTASRIWTLQFFLFHLSYMYFLCFSLSIICRAKTTQPFDFWPLTL